MVVVNQLSWANLQMSKSLQTSDAASIGRIGAVMLAASNELHRKSTGLTALALRLRQPGSWLSHAATIFINAAREQARGLLTLSELEGQLGRALIALAADLGSAKAAATVAIADSRRLDNDVSELNLRVSRQHVLVPLGSGAPTGAEAEAERITEGQSSASIALWAAEHRAIDAWKRAGTAFDFVRNGTPAMAKRWANPSWDPSKQLSRSAATVLACTSATEFGALEGGLLTGPDNRKYPLVLEIGTDMNGRAIISGRDIAANDVGWRVLAVRNGYTSSGYEASVLAKAAVIAGAFAGLPIPEGSAFDKTKLKNIQINANGSESLEDPEIMEGGSVKEATGAPERTAQEELWVAREDGIAGGKKAATPDGIGLLDNGLAGIAVARHLNDSRAARFHAVFEENDAGDLRARLVLYRVANSPGGPEKVEVQAGVVGKDNQLVGLPVTGRDRNLPTEMSAAGS